MRLLAVLALAATLAVGCSCPVVVQPLPTRQIPLSPAPLAASLGLFVDASRVPDEVAVHDSFDSPTCGFIRYPLTARQAVAQSVVDTIRATTPDVRLLDAPAHSWNLKDSGLDAALAVQVEKFTVNVSPTSTTVGAAFEAEARIALSVLVTTRERLEFRKAISGGATWSATDRWGLRGCGEGAVPATHAAERAIRQTMTELAEWITVAPELRGSPARPLRDRG